MLLNVQNQKSNKHLNLKQRVCFHSIMSSSGIQGYTANNGRHRSVSNTDDNDVVNIEIKVFSLWWLSVLTNACMRTALSPRTTQRPFHICRSQMANLRLPRTTLPNKNTAGIASVASRACSSDWWKKSFRVFQFGKTKSCLITSGQLFGN